MRCLREGRSMATPKTYDDLLRPPVPGSWDAGYWGTVSSLLRAAGSLSDSMRIGYPYGFDSGEMLDYVYRNQPSGSWGIGWVIDATHLQAIGWRGIRQRKAHMKHVMRETIQAYAANHPVQVLDVAAGPGRYLLELAQELGPQKMHALCRDWDETGLAQGLALAESMGVTIVRYERGDAFNPQDLARIRPRPQIVVVSGLYELFADNALIRRSLGGIAQLLEPGGWLFYTNQPTHQQLELIARCLPNREGKPWVMRLRPQQEMDGLVTEAGFRHHNTLIDRWGMFTVSVAQKGRS